MSSVDSITALSGYQVQSQNLATQIASLQSQISSLQSQLSNLQSQPQTVLTYDPSQQTNITGLNGIPQYYYMAQTQANLQIPGVQAQLTDAQSQLSSLQSQKTNLDQIIAQLQGNITTYVSPVSATNPTTSSDTAHNIATTLSSGVNSVTSALSSVPKTDLYIGLGVVALLLILK